MEEKTLEILDIEDIKKHFPDEWVLLGNPEYQNTKVLKGIVLVHHKDKRALAIQARTKNEDWLKEYKNLTTIYTGTFPKNRRFWL